MEDDSKKNMLMTQDVFWMALIKAMCNREPDNYNEIQVRDFKRKIQAVYSDRNGLPFLSKAKIVFDDKEISMNDFRFAYFEMKDKIHFILKQRRDEG